MSMMSQAPERRRWVLGLGAGALFLVGAAALAGAWRASVGLPGPHLPQAAAIAALSPAVRVHVAAALAALLLGAGLMLARKGRAFHRAAGWAWVALVAAVAVSSLFITSLHPGRYSFLHLLTGWTFIALPLGVAFARRHHVAGHSRTMMGLFYGGFAINIFFAFLPGRTMWNLVFS